ncbi:hypothetical protein CEP48_00865 [Mergibacter septicus]|uniref:Uncharacterized protein n=1 Tax=Mergibacter septicus TaxID=221402 RepID=A0A8D4IZ90_9PAST|nr:YmfL family putative regulatory protein [Mergibacter septicus]AWX14817.1 hypothetical protein CEP47_00865 [Mergibacter septicus]QDJ14069.1 hypothetical protein CEP48_00865 [Mergibacter septicus]UTU48483.1 hypothetical protein HLL31_06770 [Mergibacter septicus]WMR95888.1 YmfL family putative regulatory protein [Mergibacter septicus]
MIMKKIIIGMIEKCQGGKSAVAGFLGMTEQALNNRLYQTKGQRFTCEELIAIEVEYGVSDWSDEINRRLGKVSFSVPKSTDTDLVELSQLQLQELAERGILFAKLNEFLSDGVLTEEEQDVLHKLLHKSQQTTAKAIEVAIAIHKQ